MTDIYLVRHAEAEGNIYRRVHGQYNSLITPNGDLQIEALRNRFKNIHIDRVYSSDLFRTRKTAGAIYGPKGIPLNTREDLREMHLGIWEDHTWGGMERENPELFDEFKHDAGRLCLPGGETISGLSERAAGALDEIARECDGFSVAVVTHGIFIRSLMQRFLGVSEKEVNSVGYCDNAGFSHVRYSGGRYEVVAKYDNGHLGELSTLSRQNWWRGKTRDGELYFVPASFPEDGDYWNAFMSESGVSCGAGAPFSPGAPKDQRRVNSRAVSFAVNDGVRVGALQLDVCNNDEPDCGLISVLKLGISSRGAGIAVQLIGEAVSVYRAMGKKFLKCVVETENERARRFYERNGFFESGRIPYSGVEYVILKKNIFVDGGDVAVWHEHDE